MTRAPSGPPVTAGDLRVFGEEVSTAFLLDPLRNSSPGRPDGRRLAASIALHGGWTGRFTLEVSGTGAEDLARCMLRVDEVSEDDVVDAMGELVNVLGGNVKSLIVEESALGLPEVGPEPAAAPRPSQAEICRAELSWAGHPVHVRVWAVGSDRHIQERE